MHRDQLRRPLLFLPQKKRMQGQRQKKAASDGNNIKSGNRQNAARGKLDKPTNLQRVYTLFLAGYEGGPRNLHRAISTGSTSAPIHRASLRYAPYRDHA